MHYVNKFSLAFCLLFLVFLLSGCFRTNSYSNSKTSWGDVTNKFIELEQEQADIMEILQGKLPTSSAVPLNL